jgi:hypothetical protein
MLELTRLWDWPERLIATHDLHRAHDFDWCDFDCASLFAASVEAVTGVDPLAHLRPRWKWRSRGGALRAIRHAGFSDMVGITEALFPEIPPMLARRGDLVFGEVASPVASPAICMGAEMHTRDLDKGWVVMPMAHAKRAFKVG